MKLILSAIFLSMSLFSQPEPTTTTLLKSSENSSNTKLNEVLVEDAKLECKKLEKTGLDLLECVKKMREQPK